MPKTTLTVWNLPSIPDKKRRNEIEKIFRKFKGYQKCTSSKNPRKNKNTLNVIFNNQRNANYALKKTNNTQFQGSIIGVRFNKPRVRKPLPALLDAFGACKVTETRSDGMHVVKLKFGNGGSATGYVPTEKVTFLPVKVVETPYGKGRLQSVRGANKLGPPKYIVKFFKNNKPGKEFAGKGFLSPTTVTFDKSQSIRYSKDQVVSTEYGEGRVLRVLREKLVLKLDEGTIVIPRTQVKRIYEDSKPHPVSDEEDTLEVPDRKKEVLLATPEKKQPAGAEPKQSPKKVVKPVVPEKEESADLQESAI